MERSRWVALAEKLARPVLDAAAAGRLHADMPVESHPRVADARRRVAPLEAVGRVLAGIGPWLDAEGLDRHEAELRDELAVLARRALAAGADPDAPGYLRFRGEEQQTLVDAAFLAQGILRGRRALWDALDPQIRQLLHAAMEDLRNRKPAFNNWLLFGAMTEALLYATGGRPDLMRIDYALRQHEQWYLGDGVYGDGPYLHNDYYNAYVIHPMITDTLRAVSGADEWWDRMWRFDQRVRLTRAAAVQERMIAPDGSFPVLGRSICYRCGAFQTLAQAALLEMLSPQLPPGQVRAALWAVIDRTLGPAESWREDGFLRIGLVGSQPSLGEPYITTGSLYLAACAFLPLGLSPDHPFWSDAEEPWTSVRAWKLAEDVGADHAL
ncbi:MAG: DUF2264 domain-containing protein [Spirochaetota bacterium]